MTSHVLFGVCRPVDSVGPASLNERVIGVDRDLTIDSHHVFKCEQRPSAGIDDEFDRIAISGERKLNADATATKWIADLTK